MQEMVHSTEKKRIIGILGKKVIFYLKIRSVKNSENVEKLA